MFEDLINFCDVLVNDFNTISSERKMVLEKISNYIAAKHRNNNPANLLYICTHNSRRSQLGQVWAKAAANYFNVNNVGCFSGGTQPTGFNINAIGALKRTGFEISRATEKVNPLYNVLFSDQEKAIECFSKLYNDPVNPQTGFAAVMTCGEAEEDCPNIPGADLRIATTYDDPKLFDDTPLREQKYDERCRQIALETMYVFSKVKK